MTEVFDSIVLVGYALLLLSVGAYFARRQGDSEGFFLGGRGVGGTRTVAPRPACVIYRRSS